MKYAIVGTGGRHQMFRNAVTETHPEGNDLVALCDVNATRLALSASHVPDQTGNGVATYLADDFDRMIAEQQPDTVIVTVPDYLHHEYIVRALRAGCNVMTEKPMTIDLDKLKQVLDAQRETGRKVTVTFNYRYTPARTQIKDLLMSGTIGEIQAVDFRWYLDRVHGADYFRRWHRYKDKSGGLLVHKSTHHFDLMNWWLASTPRTVAANGKRVFYTPADGGAARPRTITVQRCHGCPVFDQLRLPARPRGRRGAARTLSRRRGCGRLSARPLRVRSETSPSRIRCRSRRPTPMACSSTTRCAPTRPWEGLEIKFQGTKGELTHRHIEVHGVFAGKRDETRGRR